MSEKEQDSSLARLQEVKVAYEKAREKGLAIAVSSGLTSAEFRGLSFISAMMLLRQRLQSELDSVMLLMEQAPYLSVPYPEVDEEESKEMAPQSAAPEQETQKE